MASRPLTPPSRRRRPSGTRAFSEEQQEHGGAAVSTAAYRTTARFWEEAFQNWQSEFLSIGVLLVLSIWLRERGSPESKPVHAAHWPQWLTRSSGTRRRRGGSAVHHYAHLLAPRLASAVEERTTRLPQWMTPLPPPDLGRRLASERDQHKLILSLPATEI